MDLVEASLEAAVGAQEALQCAPLIRALADLPEPPSAAAVRNLMLLMSSGVQKSEGVLFDLPTHLLPTDQDSDVLVGENLRVRNRSLIGWVTNRTLPAEMPTEPVGSVARALPMDMPLVQAGVTQVVIYMMHDGAGAVRLYYKKQGKDLRTTYLTLNGVLLQQSKITEPV